MEPTDFDVQLRGDLTGGIKSLSEAITQTVGDAKRFANYLAALIHGQKTEIPIPLSDKIVIANPVLLDKEPANREFGWGLPEDVATTIAGLVLHEARRIPEVGQIYAFYGFRFEILKREGTRIAELRIVPPAVIQAA